jgi:acetyl-CoA carboxylase carboxyltransferase component
MEEQMDVLGSRIDTEGRAFKANHAAMSQLVEELRAHLERARAGGGAKAQARHRQLEKLFVRERIDKLLDSGSPFLELGALSMPGQVLKVLVEAGAQVIHDQPLMVAQVCAAEREQVAGGATLVALEEEPTEAS